MAHLGANLAPLRRNVAVGELDKLGKLLYVRDGPKGLLLVGVFLRILRELLLELLQPQVCNFSVGHQNKFCRGMDHPSNDIYYP